MNDFNRNTRTLIVCFVVAMFALIPLRFVELGQKVTSWEQPEVLGESVVQAETVKLEAPYDTLEKCFNQDEIDLMRNEVYQQLEEGKVSEEEAMSLFQELGNNVCQ